MTWVMMKCRSAISSFLDLLMWTQVRILLVLLAHLLSFVSIWCPMFSWSLGRSWNSVIDTSHSVTCAQCMRIYGTSTFQMGTNISMMEVEYIDITLAWKKKFPKIMPKPPFSLAPLIMKTSMRSSIPDTFTRISATQLDIIFFCCIGWLKDEMVE